MFDKLKNIIDEWDPIDLLSHAPDDEYHAEIDEIAEKIKDGHDAKALGLVIHGVFTRMFGNSFKWSIEDCEAVAEKILTKI